MKLKEIKLGKLNLLDLGIIVILLAFIGVFAINHLKTQKEGVTTGANGASTSFCYTFCVEGLSDTSEQMLQVGDEVYDKVANTYIGKIKELEIQPAQGLIEKENGEIVEAEIPRKIDVKMVIETEGTIKNGEYLANGLIRILVGNVKQIKTKYLMCSGSVTAIEKAES